MLCLVKLACPWRNAVSPSVPRGASRTAAPPVELCAPAAELCAGGAEALPVPVLQLQQWVLHQPTAPRAAAYRGPAVPVLHLRQGLQPQGPPQTTPRGPLPQVPGPVPALTVPHPPPSWYTVDAFQFQTVSAAWTTTRTTAQIHTKGLKAWRKKLSHFLSSALSAKLSSTVLPVRLVFNQC